MTEDQPTEPEVKKRPTISARVKDLEAKVNAWDEILLESTEEAVTRATLVQVLSGEVRDLRDTVHALKDEVTWLRQRLHVVAPEPTIQNCTKCGRQLLRPGGKCGFCQHQN